MATKRRTDEHQQMVAEIDSGMKARVKDPVIETRLVKLDKVDRERVKALDEVMADANEVTIVSGDRQLTVQGPLLVALQKVAFALDHDESVTVVGNDTETSETVLSSQEAADRLNVSRPYVVKLARTGELAHSRVGNRHRFALADVLAYAETMGAEREAALTAIAPAAGYTVEDF